MATFTAPAPASSARYIPCWIDASLDLTFTRPALLDRRSSPSNVVPFPVQQQAPQGPAPVPGAGTGDGDAETAQAWTLFFSDIANGQYANNWEDVRGSKRSDKSPDFKHKSLKDSGGKYKISLWVEGKKNPRSYGLRPPSRGNTVHGRSYLHGAARKSICPRR